MKKVINKATDVVNDMLDGLCFVHDDLLERLDGYEVIVRRAKKT